MCHPFVELELRFEPGSAEPIDREGALAELREHVSTWAEWDEPERPNVFLPIGFHDPRDEDPTVALARAEAMREIALEACIDPQLIVRDAELMEPLPDSRERRRAVLVSTSPVSCLL